MYKHLLVALDGSAHARVALLYAADLTRRLGAELHGLHVVDSKVLHWPWTGELSASLGMAPNVDLHTPLREFLRRYGETVLEEFLQVCQEHGVSHRASLEEGVVGSTICEAAKLADLVVMGERGQNAELGGTLLGSNLETVVRACGRPVLVTTETFEPLTRALVGYDGSRAAASALEMAARFTQVLQLPLTILTVSSNKQHSQALLEEAGVYVEPFGLSFETEWREGDAAEQICVTAQERGANLIIVGAYGHSRFRHLVLGSTTEEVLRYARVPVLLHR